MNNAATTTEVFGIIKCPTSFFTRFGPNGGPLWYKWGQSLNYELTFDK